MNGFLLDMPRLFEDFVTVALREALVSAYGGRVDNQDRNHFDAAGPVRLRPDIVWKIRGSAVAVIDAKYKAEKPGIEIFCHAVDLNQPPNELLILMSDLAERIAATRLQPRPNSLSVSSGVRR